MGMALQTLHVHIYSRYASGTFVADLGSASGTAFQCMQFLAVFICFYIPVLSRSYLTSWTPDKDQKIEQLFYFLLVLLKIFFRPSNGLCLCSQWLLNFTRHLWLLSQWPTLSRTILLPFFTLLQLHVQLPMLLVIWREREEWEWKREGREKRNEGGTPKLSQEYHRVQGDSPDAVGPTWHQLPSIGCNIYSYLS